MANERFDPGTGQARSSRHCICSDALELNFARLSFDCSDFPFDFRSAIRKSVQRKCIGAKRFELACRSTDSGSATSACGCVDDHPTEIAKNEFADGVRPKTHTHTHQRRAHRPSIRPDQSRGQKQCENFSHMENCWSYYLCVPARRNARYLPFILWQSTCKRLEAGQNR